MEYKTTVRGIELTLDTSSPMLDYYAQNCEKIETEVFHFIDSLKPDVDLFLDLGACEGRYAVYAGKRKINTVAIEPELQNFSILEANIRHNALSNIRPIKAALGRYAHSGELVIGQNTPGGHQKIVLDTTSRNNYKQTKLPKQTIDIVPLDSLNIKATAVKIDVDGSELETLLGGERTIRDCKQLIIELLSTDPNFDHCQALLTRWGFVTMAVFPIMYPWIEKHLANYWMVNRHQGTPAAV